MKKVVGIALFLLVLYVAVLLSGEGARTASNHFNLREVAPTSRINCRHMAPTSRSPTQPVCR